MSNVDPELADLLARMYAVANRVYALFFQNNMGGDVHGFIEINGLISKYIDLCRSAAETGIDFRHVNVHSGTAFPIEAHDAAYLGKKIACMFGPSLHANPEALAAFKRELGLADDGERWKARSLCAARHAVAAESCDRLSGHAGPHVGGALLWP